MSCNDAFDLILRFLWRWLPRKRLLVILWASESDRAMVDRLWDFVLAEDRPSREPRWELTEEAWLQTMSSSEWPW